MNEVICMIYCQGVMKDSLGRHSFKTIPRQNEHIRIGGACYLVMHVIHTPYATYDNELIVSLDNL